MYIVGWDDGKNARLIVTPDWENVKTTVGVELSDVIKGQVDSIGMYECTNFEFLNGKEYFIAKVGSWPRGK